MPITKWDKFYLIALILSIAVFLSIYGIRGDIEAQQVAREIIVPFISVLLLIGVALQRIRHPNQNKPPQEPNNHQSPK
ncbi:MAG: hypothetical protein ACE5R6_14960 [Candidatus Heimdallarchaeota archaeon]